MCSKPIKILAIVCQLNSGGLENRLMDIIRNIDKSKVQIDVYTCRMTEGIFDEEVKLLGGQIFYNPPLCVKNVAWYIFYFKKFLLEHPEYKIVHAHQDAWCSVFCIGAYLAKVPIRIAHSRTAISTLSVRNCIKNIIKIPTRKYATHYFAVSDLAGQWLFGDRLYEKGMVWVWPNAIDIPKFQYDEIIRNQVRDRFHWAARHVIMHVGNFTPPKNHQFLLKIFNAVIKKDQQALLVLVGSGNHAELDMYIQQNSLDNSVIFLGRRDDVNDLLQGADVFVFPSLFEGLPGAVIEAQAAGLPCIISDTIDKAVCITPNITCLSLKEETDAWADKIISSFNFKRKDTNRYLEENGFDIKTLVRELSRFYEDTMEEQTNVYRALREVD